MVHTQIKLVEKVLTSARHGRHKLDELDADRMARHLVLFQPDEAAVSDLMDRARRAIPGLARTDTVLKVLRHNPRCVLAIARKSRSSAGARNGEGFIAILPLNNLGMQQLALDVFDGSDPDLRFVAKEYERPAGIYMWGVFAPGPLAGAMALFMREMSAPPYAGIDLYSRPNTDVGRRFNEVLGTTRDVAFAGIEAPHLYMFSRKPPTPLYDSYTPGAGKQEIGITVARTFDDLMKVAAVRNAVYVGEQECPFDEEYDGNDLSATHLLAYIGDEPVGCLRLRFFADFAKFERMAIRKEFRKSRAAIQLARAGFKFCQKKGYTRVYGHIQERLVPFWSRFGFRPMENGRKFSFSDFEYIEIVAEIDRDPNAVTIGNDPYLLIRPEGRWHVPGVLEDSATRPAAAQKQA